MAERSRDEVSGEIGSSARAFSHGRGGAGNIAKERRPSQGPSDLKKTPTIKASKYTTGRGGTGNMAIYDKARPEVARASQDVEGPLPTKPESLYHVGRGGAGNSKIPTEQDLIKGKEHNQRRSVDVERQLGEESRFKEKGRDLLEKVGLKK